MSSPENPQGEVILKKNKFHFFKRKGSSKALSTRIKREASTSETRSILKVSEKNLSRETLLDPKDFLSNAEHVQPTNKNKTTAAISNSDQKIEETQKNSILNERSLNTRSFKKLMHSFKGTKKSTSRNKKEGVDQKEGTIFSIFSDEKETDIDVRLMRRSTKELNNSKSNTQNHLMVANTSKNNQLNEDYDQSQTFTKKEDKTFLSEDTEVGREERSDYTQLVKSRPCKHIPQSQGKNTISNKISITEKTGGNIVNIYNILVSEKILPIIDTSLRVDLFEELTEKIYIGLQSNLTDYSKKYVNFQEMLHEKEEKIKMLETSLVKLKHQLTTSTPKDVFLTDEVKSKDEANEDMNIIKPSKHQINTRPCSEHTNKRDDHIYNSLKNLETKYDQLYNAYGCLENESQQVRNQSILLAFYRDKSIKFLGSLHQLFEGLLHKSCLIKYQTSLKELTSNYYLHKTGIILGSQIESTKSEIDYFFDEIARDTLIKKIVIKLSSLTNKTKILEEQLRKYVEAVPSSGSQDAKLEIEKKI